jgi:hypothetical protein
MTMGLFSRRKRQEPEEIEGLDALDSDAPEIDDAPEDEDAEDEARSEDEDAAADAPRADHLEDGPYDEADAPEEDRIDLGGLLVPTIDGMELRMEVDQRTSAVTGANLVIEGSSLQVQAFAAPKSRGLWEDVRSSLRESVVKQGGTAETRPGVFGTELITRLPVKRATVAPATGPPASWASTAGAGSSARSSPARRSAIPCSRAGSRPSSPAWSWCAAPTRWRPRS